MDRSEAVKILEIQLDVTSVNTPSCIKLHEALELAIEALKEPTGDYEFFGGTYAKEGDAESATTMDCISRQQAIEAVTNTIRDKFYFDGWHEQLLETGLEIENLIKELPPVTPTERTGECEKCRNHKLIKAIENRSKQNRADIRIIKARLGGDTE